MKKIKALSLTKLRHFCLVLVAQILSVGLFAQVGPPNSGTALAGTTAYPWTTAAGTYTALTASRTVWQSGATVSTNANSGQITLPWAFRYNNRNYTTINISNNGFITFGANLPTVTTYTPLSTNANPAYEGAISGLGANLVASTAAGAAPEISYETVGSDFVIQFQDLAATATPASRISFQIRLTQTTNVIKIVYGGTFVGPAANTTCQIGLKGAESSDVNNRTSTTGGFTTTAGTAATSTVRWSSTLNPTAGLTWTWTPGSTWGAASYATLPFLQDFTTWTNGLNTGDIVGTNMRNWPSRGNSSWRSSATLVSGFTSTTGWSTTSGQTATYSGAAVAPGARFHSYDCNAGAYGDMDFYLDMSSSPIGVYNVQFLYNNPTGTDVIQVFYSGDGGATFTQVGSNITTGGNVWNTFSNNMAGTATSIIRIRSIGDYGNDDINIDNFRVTALTCASPSALAYIPSSATGGTLSWTNPTAGTPTNYNYEIRTSGAAGSGATGLVTSGTIANPTNSAAISAGTLLANTAYSAYIRTDCGGGDLSGWSSATTFTTPCTPSVAPFSQTFATAYSLAPTGNPTCWREATGTINLSGNSTVTTGTNNWGTSNFANVVGNTGFKINLYGTNNAWVITEPITLGAGNWALGYSMAVTGYNSTASVADLGTHAVRIIVSTDFGTTWSSANIIKTHTGAAAYSNTGATEYVSLNAYAGQTVQIGFVATTSTTSPDIDFHLDNIAVIVPCSGTPVIGASAAASPTTLGCSGSVVSLTMDAGAQVGAGVSYQWQSSTDGVTFNNISGATGSTYNTPSAVVGSTYYRGTATCSFSGLSRTTTDFFVEAGFPTPTVAAFPPQHCGTGGTSVVNATIIGANPYDTFVWSSPQTGVLSNETNTTADFTITESAAFTYTVTDTTSGCTRTVSQSLNVLDGVSPTPTASPSIVCVGGTSVLASGLSASSFSSTSIAHNPISASTTLVNAGTAVVPLNSGTLDDGGWSGVPIGFTFNFFGTDFTTCNIGTNGTVMFGTYNGSSLVDFSFATLPSASEPNPMIAVLAMDHDLTGASGGAIKYSISGYPGNRIFVLAYDNVKEYGDTKFSTATMHLYEATGEIEVHVTSSTNFDRNKVVGINGPGGLIGTLAFNSGANSTIASPFAFRFTPPKNYTTAWMPSSDISGSNSGTNLFSRTTNALNTAGTINFNLQLTNQQTGCVNNVPISVLVANIGESCNDNNPCTVNDLFQSDCTCVGTFTDGDNDGTCDANDFCAGAEPGTSCDDNNSCTVNDLIQSDCTCAGTFADADNDGTCDANDLCSGPEAGTACDDNNPCTVNDFIQSDCTCAGIFADADNDGICDANDLCAGAEPGNSCDDNNPCTVSDFIQSDCICAGTFADSDNDGICDANDSNTISITCPDNVTVNCVENLFDLNLVGTVNIQNAEGFDLLINYSDSLLNPFGNPCGKSYSRNYVVTFSAIAGDESALSCTQSIQVFDFEPPVFINAPANATYQCIEEVPAYGSLEAIDGCGGSVVVQQFGIAPPRVSNEVCNQTIERRWTATDECGNVAYHTQIININDTTAPELIVPSSYTVECNDEVTFGPAYAIDNCSPSLSIIESVDTVVTGCGITFTRNFSVSDDCGNTTTGAQIIQVMDTTAPVWSADNEPFFMYECNTTAEVVQPVASDNCNTIDYLYTDGASESNGCTSRFVRSWIAIDACGNVSTAFNQTISFEDTTAPSLFGCPSDELLSCVEQVPAPTGITVSDNCDSNVAVTMVETCIGCAASGGVAFDLFTPGRPTENPCNYPYDWAMALFSLPSNYRWYQLDTNTPAEMVYNADGSVTVTGRVFNVINPTGGFDFNVTYGNGKTWSQWTSDQTPSGFKADCGGIDANFGNWMYYILQPSAAVELTGWGSLAGSLLNLTHAPSNQYFGFQIGDGANNYNADYGAGGWFNYSGVFLYQGQPVSSGLSGGIGDFAFRIGQCSEYSIIRTWTAIDCSGNTSSCSQIIEFRDITPPVFTNCPSAVYAQCGAEIPAPIPAHSILANDENYGPTAVSYLGESFNQVTPCDYEITHTYSATDYSENTSYCSYTIYVNDETAPIFNANNESIFTFECNESVPVITPLAVDNCSSVEVSYNDNISGNDCNTYISRVWTATDGCGNSSTFVQNITIADTEGPVFAGVIEIERPCDDYQGIYLTASDNCTDNVEVLLIVDEQTQNGSCAGEIVRTYGATDACGNHSEFIQIIQLTDNVAPVCSNVPAPLTVDCGATIPTYLPVWTDQCDNQLLLTENTTFQQNGCVVTLTTIYTATDDCANVGSVTRVVSIVDTTAPVASNVPANQSIECSSFSGSIGAPTFTDNCNSLTLTSNVTEEIVGCDHVYTYVWTATDECGNSTTVSTVITVFDQTNPIFTEVPVGGTFSCEQGIDFGLAVAYDVCGDAIVTFNDNIIGSNCPQTYTIVRTWTATDDCGNTSSATSIYNVTDDVTPIFTAFPADASIECSPTELPAAGASASDNCATDVTINYIDVLVAQNNCQRTYERRYTAADDCGNTTTQVQMIYVNDTTAPEYSGDATITVSCNEFDANGIYVTATDNCGEANITILYDEPTGVGCGNSVIRHYAANDGCSNSSYFNQTIVVTDSEAPVASNDPADATYGCNDSWSPAVVTFSDNCDAEVFVFSAIEETGGQCNIVYHFTWTATDDCGNTTIVDQYITVLDETAPVFEPQASIEQFNCTNEIPLRTPAVSDNCSSFDLQHSDVILTVDGLLQMQRTWTATDACGNQATSVEIFLITLGEPGMVCDDNEPCTVNDLIQSDCTCTGTFADADFDGTCDANDLCSGGPEPGSECNDRDDCTVDDMIQADCSCVGVYLDSDADGTCDAFDLCADSPEPGMACNDGNPCTINDTVNASCECVGTPVETAVSVTTVHACEPYTWNGTTYAVSGNYTFATQTVLGCDSLARLALTVGTPTFSSQTITNCGSYTWNGSVYTQSGTYTYVTTNSTGCPKTETLNLTVNNLSVAASSVATSANNVNAGTSVTLTVQGGSLGTGASWKWYRGSCGGTLVGTGASITLTANVTDTYYVRAEGTCNTTTCVPVTVTVLSGQCGPELVSASSTRICSGSSTTLSVLGTLYPGAIWRWRRNSCTGTIVGTGANLVVAPTATTTYYVRAEGGTCGITLCLAITIVVDKMPATPSVISGPTTGLCNAQNVTYSVTPVSTVQQYNWTVPQGIILVSGQGTASVTVNVSNFINTNPTNGNPAICVTAQNSCGNSPIRCLSLTTYPDIPASISGTATPCTNTINTYSCPAVYGATSYAWTVPTGWVIQSGQGTSSITVLCNGTSGNVRVRTNNACGNSTFRTLACTPAVCGTTAMPMQLELWPNPTSDRVFMAHGDAIPTHLQIYDMLGRDIYNGPWVPEYDVSNLAGGIYFVRATSGGESVVKRLEVVR